MLNPFSEPGNRKDNLRGCQERGHGSLVMQSILWGNNGCLREPHPHSLYQGAYVLDRAGGMRLDPKAQEG